MPIICHFRNFKALLVTSLKQRYVQAFTFTFAFGFRGGSHLIVIDVVFQIGVIISCIITVVHQ